MAKGKGRGQPKGRKRKPVESLSCEETSSSSSQSQDSLVPHGESQSNTVKYVPRFGNAFKRVKLDLDRERRSSQSQLQGDIESCTQPTGGLSEKFSSEDMVSATQPVQVSKTEASVNEKFHNSETIPSQVTCPTVPGLSLSQVEATPPSSPSVKTVEIDNVELPSNPPVVEAMNLDLLDPFSDEEKLIAQPAESPLSSPTDHPATEQEHIESEPLVISTSPPDAALPNSQDLPEDSAQTESFYREKSESKKDLDCVISEDVTREVDEERVMQEMMTLRAEDFMESQLSYATVPTNSPTGVVPQSKTTDIGHHSSSNAVTHRPSYTFNQPKTNTHNTDGGSALKGLIQELSSINQYILRCKRELESARRQREMWLRSRQHTTTGRPHAYQTQH